MRYRSFVAALASLTLLGSPEAMAQRPALTAAVHTYVTVDTPVVALTHARVIDGTGAPARDDQTLIIRDGRIAALGDIAVRRDTQRCAGHRPHRESR